MKKYKCDICGKNHSVYNSFEMPLPDVMIEMTDEDRDKRVKENDGLFLVDEEHFFVNVYINVELVGQPDPFFYWKVWATISYHEFLERFEELNTGRAVEFEAELASDLPIYTESLGLKGTVFIQLNEEGMIAEIVVEQDSQLQQDQAAPITENRVIELMQMIHHHPLKKGVEDFDKPFAERLEEEILKTKKNKVARGEDFVINLSTGGILFQIISNKMLETSHYEISGFGLHVSFDLEAEDLKEALTRFEQQPYAADFDFHLLDEVPTYQMDMGLDSSRIHNMVTKLIIDVFEEEVEEVEISNFE